MSQAKRRATAIPATKEPPTSWVPGLLDRAFRWALAARHATYSFAALRIIYGFIILLVTATSFPDRHYLWGVGSTFIDPVAANRGYPWFFDAIFTKTDAASFDVAYVLLMLLAIAFMVGVKTRWVGPILLVFWVGLSVNSTLLTNGGDVVLRITFLFALFADLGGRWSVDSWLRRRRAEAGDVAAPGPLARRIPPWVGPLLHNTALVLCAWQILLIYVSAALLKLQGPEWLDGTATYYSLALDVFRPFPWANDLVSTFAFPVYALTYMTVFFQLLFPVLLLWRPTRIAALIGITGTHLGIGLFLGLWPFSLAMIALDFLFVRDTTWVWGIALAKTWWNRLLDSRQPRDEADRTAVESPVQPVFAVRAIEPAPDEPTADADRPMLRPRNR